MHPPRSVAAPFGLRLQRCLALTLLASHGCRCERSLADLAPDFDDSLLQLADEAYMKPIRGVRQFEGEEGLEVKPTKTARCNRTLAVKGLSTVFNCRPECPYMAQLPGPCQFKCITRAMCQAGEGDPLAMVPDDDDMTCRRCSAAGCKKCDEHDPTVCAEDGCAVGYVYDLLHKKCTVVGGPFFIGVKLVIVGLVAYLLLWYFDLACVRPAANEKGLEAGLQFREATKLGHTDSAGRQQHSLCTNLHAAASCKIAGPGTVLHFNFQLVVIIWSLVLAGVWFLLAEMQDPALMLVGLRHADTPDKLCALVFWGHDVNVRAKAAKIGFLVFAYVFTFVGTVVYAMVQRKRFHAMDDSSTMKDFVALVRGLPIRRGTDASVEDDTLKLLESATNRKLVGVSVAWYTAEREEEVQKALEAETVALEEAWNGGAPEEGVAARPRTASLLRRVLGRMDGVLFNIHGVELEGRDASKDLPVKDLLAELQTSGFAFAVFNSEEARDAAVKVSQESRGFAVPGEPERRVWLQCKHMEPETVMFASLGISDVQFASNIFWGWVLVGVAQSMWIFCFFLPYAYYISAFTYAHGDEPDAWAKIFLTLLVIVGNQVMYQVCSMVAYMAGFKFKDYVEAYYTLLYSATCLINVLVDLFITAVLAYRQMVGLGVPTVDGGLLSDLKSYHDIFDASSMQRSLGIQNWLYCFPGVFLIPFIIEPVVTLMLMRHLMQLLVRAHAELTTRQAQVALTPFVPMDMGRYADILLNVLLATISLFFASGFYLKIFLALAGSHVFVIIYDHYRVLRCVPAFYYASDLIERFSQAMLGVPCGMILVAIIIKSNCISGPREHGPFCVRDGHLALRAAVAFTLHILAYIFIHRYVVEWAVILDDHKKASDDYATVAATTPASWFSRNPVHCLRSKFVHEQDPPCIFHVDGKEHLLRANPSIGCHYEKPHLAEGAGYS